MHTLSPCLFSLNSSASLSLPSAENLLGLTSTLFWLGLAVEVLLAGMVDLWFLVEVGRDDPSLARLVAGPVNILLEYSETVYHRSC